MKAKPRHISTSTDLINID